MAEDYVSDRTASREDIVAVLDGVADGILSGSVQLGDGADAVAVDAPDEASLEIGVETAGGEVSLELELEWSVPEGESAVSLPEERSKSERVELPDEGATGPVSAADATQSLARFEVFRDRADEWRWRLRHRNGNIIATSGEGYTQKHNAWNGLQSVMENAPEAEVTEDSTD